MPNPAASRLRSKGKSGEMESAGMMRWLLTYADMITLLLALFIILFAISTISKVKLQRLAHEISAGFSAPDALNNPPNGGSTGSETGATTESNLATIQAQLDKYIKEKHLTSQVQTKLERKGLTITLLTDKNYYDSGSADLRPDTKQLLDHIAGPLRKLDGEVRVEGNTDNVPIATSAYPTNWELSVARATNVARYLVEREGLNPTHVSAAGFAEFRPRLANDTPEHRQQNRRTDIVIVSPLVTQAAQRASSEEGG